MSSPDFLLGFVVQAVLDLDQERKKKFQSNIADPACGRQRDLFKVRKLILKIKKADNYIAYLAGRISWLQEILDDGRMPTIRHMVISKHRDFSERRLKHVKKKRHLIDQIQIAARRLATSRACGTCKICRQESWK